MTKSVFKPFVASLAGVALAFSMVPATAFASADSGQDAQQTQETQAADSAAQQVQDSQAADAAQDTQSATEAAAQEQTEPEQVDTQKAVKKKAKTVYKVKFKSKGGSKVATQKVTKGKKAKKPKNPTREGYKFKGWYLDGAKYSFAKKVKASITLTAKWEKIQPKVTYKVDTTGTGWNATKKNKALAGKAEWDSTVERIRIKALGPYAGGVKYKVRTVSGKWGSWTKEYKPAGTNKKGMEAIKIKLTGNLAKHYDVYYRVYSPEWRWLGWAKNGQAAGTAKHEYPISALRIALVKKGKAAPGTTKQHYTTKAVKGGGREWTMNHKAQGESSSTSWLIMVNRENCWVGVFKGKKGNWKMKKFFRCSTGRKGHRTPTGRFSIGHRFTPLNGKYTEYWAIQVVDAIHFHSILYYKGTHTVAVPTLGKHISLGCIRCPTEMASWMYHNLPDDTRCTIY